MSLKLEALSKMIDELSTGWKAVGITLAIAATTMAAGRGVVGLLRTPALVQAHDSAMRAENDTLIQIERESLRQHRLTNCILLGLESKLSCSLHASH